MGENVATINSKNLLNEPVVASATLPGTTQENAPKGREQRVVNQAQANQVNMVVLANKLVVANKVVPANNMVLVNMVVLATKLVLANKMVPTNNMVLANMVVLATKLIIANKLLRNKEEANKE